WQAARELDPGVDDESGLAGAREGHLGELFRAAGLADVEERGLTVTVAHPGFDEWWEPFTLGVGPAGLYVQGLDEPRRERLRERCRELLPPPPPFPDRTGLSLEKATSTDAHRSPGHRRRPCRCLSASGRPSRKPSRSATRWRPSAARSRSSPPSRALGLTERP